MYIMIINLFDEGLIFYENDYNTSIVADMT